MIRQVDLTDIRQLTLMGPVNGQQYPGNIPMTPYGELPTDDEMATILTLQNLDYRLGDERGELALVSVTGLCGAILEKNQSKKESLNSFDFTEISD